MEKGWNCMAKLIYSTVMSVNGYVETLRSGMPSHPQP